MKKLITLLVALAMALCTFAYDFEASGIYYNITSYSAPYTVAVTWKQGYSSEYTGTVTIPASVNYNGTSYSVTSIGGGAFGGCSGLTSITIPNSITSIGLSAFWGCTGLTSVILPNSVAYIDERAFSDCRSLTSITIPNSITSIEWETFSGCSGLASITVPNSVTYINSNAFKGTAWYDNQPDGVVYAGKVLYKYKGTIPNNTSITLREGTVAITGEAFSGCSGLTSITIPNSVTDIGWDAFEGTAWYDNQPDGVVYAGKVLYKYKGIMPNNTSIIIQEGTVAITRGAFYNCSGLTSVIIPNSITSIGYYVFEDCTGLTSITIPNSVTSIKNYAFSGCSSLTSIPLPNSVISIGYEAFSKCSRLTSITIPNSVAYIDERAFEQCSNLTSISVEGANANYSSSGGVLFDKNTNLLIQYPDGKQGAYTIPGSVKSIANHAFDDCDGLTSILLPNSVINIRSHAFAYCSNLTSIRVAATTPPRLEASGVFNGVNKTTCVLEVPIGSKAAYQTADQWKDFLTINEVNLPNSISQQTAENIKIYAVNGELIIEGAENNARVELYDLSGILHYSGMLYGGKITLPANLPKGIYIVKACGIAVKVLL